MDDKDQGQTQNWTDEEVRLIVADYFDMLFSEIQKTPINKSAHRKKLKEAIDRSDASIEFKHRNISAVMDELGFEWIEGYRPASNFQRMLVNSVEQFLLQPQSVVLTAPVPDLDLGLREPAMLFLEAPPIAAESAKLPIHMERLVRKFDPVERDFRNRTLGEAGEKAVLQSEQLLLRAQDRADLARKVRWVSKEDGDGAGYDILSFDPKGREKFIEVKTTNGWQKTPFFMSRNEKDFAEEAKDSYRLVRLYDFRRSCRAFELAPPLDRHWQFSAELYRASLRALET